MNGPTKILILGVLCALAAAIPATAMAGGVTCGKVITKDMKLTSDLDCSAGGSNGLEVGADGITIDLGGHTIVGAGAADGYEGIENSGYGGVTVRSGGVTGFKDAFILTNVARMRIAGVTVRSKGEQASNGVYSTYGSGIKVVGSKFVYAKHGVELINGSQNSVIGNRFVKNDIGVFTTNEAYDRIANNVSDGFSITTTGFHSQDDYRTNYENDVADGGYRGFYVNQPRSVAIKGAEANDNGYSGIYIDGAAGLGYSAKVSDSTANDNAEYGIYGVFGIKGNHNTAVGNHYYNCHLAACNG